MQPQEDTKLSEATTPAPLSNLPSTTESVQKGQQIVTQISEFLAQAPYLLGRLFNQYRQPLTSVALIIATIVTLRVVLAIVDALNGVPLLAPTFKLIGFCYSIWFVNRYLLKKPNRQELWQELQQLLHSQEDVVTSDNGD